MTVLLQAVFRQFQQDFQDFQRNKADISKVNGKFPDFSASSVVYDCN